MIIVTLSFYWHGYGIYSFPGFERKLTSKLSWGKFHILGGLVTKDSTRPGVIGISYPAWSPRRVSLEFPTRPGESDPYNYKKVFSAQLKHFSLNNFGNLQQEHSITITKTNEKLFLYMSIESFNQALGD